MSKIRKAIAAAIAGLASYLVSALTAGHQSLSMALVVQGLVAALVAGLAVFAVRNAKWGTVSDRPGPEHRQRI
jgi:branched-subunit amino acid ABC-type transport system permease component